MDPLLCRSEKSGVAGNNLWGLDRCDKPIEKEVSTHLQIPLQDRHAALQAWLSEALAGAPYADGMGGGVADVALRDLVVAAAAVVASGDSAAYDAIASGADPLLQASLPPPPPLSSTTSPCVASIYSHAPAGTRAPCAPRSGTVREPFRGRRCRSPP